MTTMVQLWVQVEVQTNLGGQVALSDSNFVPCPRNLPRKPWKMSKLDQATTRTHPFVELFLKSS